MLPGLEYHTFLHHSQTRAISQPLYRLLEYHTFLHHSQTYKGFFYVRCLLEYHTFLHHSQTNVCQSRRYSGLEYHTFLHHSQTQSSACYPPNLLEYHTFLHHSQTSNSKMKCYHRHKTRYPSCVILIDFTTISIYNIPHSSFQASSFLTFHKQNFRLLISNFLNQFLYLFICQIAPDIYENKYLC